MFIYKLSELPDNSEFIFGGKAASLDRMLKAGLPVPEGWAVSCEAFIENKLSKDAAQELDMLIKNLSPRYTYAVRSSAIGEDGMEASFAGAYETVTDVKIKEIAEAVSKVAVSAENERVKVYADEHSQTAGKAAVIIQRFINPDYAGVIFTADPMSADMSVMNGNFISGEGEKLVSGESPYGEFIISSMKYAYNGAEQMRPYSRKLYSHAKKISKLYGTPQDIEWAVQNGKVYILQARPITTLFKNKKNEFDINDSLCGNYLLSKTNVGEIFLRPVSPVTYGIIASIGDVLGIPLIANVCGQLYLNISGVCSVMVSFGMTKEKALKTLSELSGGVPKDIEMPVFPYDRNILLGKIKGMIKQMVFGQKNAPDYGKDFDKRITDIANSIISQIKLMNSPEKLGSFWTEQCEPFMNRTLTAITTGLSVKSLFSTREKLEKICSSELADSLLSNSSSGGGIESLGTLLAIDDVINGRISREEYVTRYGHRHTDEMELAMPYPYEDSSFPDNVINEYKSSGINAYDLKAEQEKRFTEAKSEFIKQHPAKKRWLEKLLENYSAAVAGREKIRSDALRLFCVIREFLLKAGELTGLGDDIFMLYIEEVKSYLYGDTSPAEYITKRREKYNEQLSMPKFPNVILGRFTVEEWQQSGSNSGFYSFGMSGYDECGDVITGVAGSCGQAEGYARVLGSIDEAGKLEKGEILVVSAANIGWVKVFPKAAGLVTDIGAPLSHAVIVARELGIPAVVSCQYASGSIKNGDRIRVDGTSGRVTILERK